MLKIISIVHKDVSYNLINRPQLKNYSTEIEGEWFKVIIDKNEEHMSAPIFTELCAFCSRQFSFGNPSEVFVCRHCFDEGYVSYFRGTDERYSKKNGQRTMVCDRCHRNYLPLNYYAFCSDTCLHLKMGHPEKQKSNSKPLEIGKKIYLILDKLQQVLYDWLERYNTQRHHQGKETILLPENKTTTLNEQLVGIKAEVSAQKELDTKARRENQPVLVMIVSEGSPLKNDQVIKRILESIRLKKLLKGKFSKVITLGRNPEADRMIQHSMGNIGLENSFNLEVNKKMLLFARVKQNAPEYLDFLPSAITYKIGDPLTGFNHDVTIIFPQVKGDTSTPFKAEKKRKPSSPEKAILSNDLSSKKEIECLNEKAQLCVDSRDFNQAIICYDKLIEYFPRQPHYYRDRACAFACLGVSNNSISYLNKAIKDITTAINLDPDDGENYWRRGSFFTFQFAIEKILPPERKKRLLQKIIEDYQDAIKKNPSLPQLWLDIIEINILLNNWDDAIGKYGECQSYINSKEHKLIRAWLGCLAMIFAGDPLEEDVTEPLYDHAIRLDKSHWFLGNINSFFEEISLKEMYKDKLKKAKEVHQVFISHFDESPW